MPELRAVNYHRLWRWLEIMHLEGALLLPIFVYLILDKHSGVILHGFVDEIAIAHLDELFRPPQAYATAHH